MKKFLKENGQAILKGLLLLVATIVAYELCKNSAMVQRGYDAIGGEIFVFLVPFFAYLAMKHKEEKEAEDAN